MPTTKLGKLRALAFQAGFYIWTLVAALAFLPVAPFARGRLMRRYAGLWENGTLLWLRLTTGIRHELVGLEKLPAGPVIFACKHQSAWETVVFHTFRPDTVIGLKEELTRIPIFGWYLRLGQNIVIDRRGAARALRSLIEGARRATAAGCSILIFPEGTRQAPEAPPAYKPGVAALYAALDVPVVPVALNSGLFWGRGVLAKRPGTIRLVFLEPIEPGLDRASFMAVLMERTEAATTALLRIHEGTPDRPASEARGWINAAHDRHDARPRTAAGLPPVERSDANRDHGS